MIPDWCSRYVGKPYRRDNEGGYSCSGLIRSIYREVYHVELNDLVQESISDDWRRIAPPPDVGDVLVFQLDRDTLHVGLALDGSRMIHADEGLGQVVIEPYNYATWKQQLKHIYRHRQHP